MDQLVVDGVRTPVLATGPKSASDAVLFVHGNPGSRLDWADLIGRCGAFARAIAFDMPGFGEADKPRDFDYTVDGYARFIESARQRLGIDRVHLVVHDFGGPFGMAWAAAHVEHLASITIINAPPMRDYRWYLLAKVWRTRGAGELLHWTLTPWTFRWLLRRGNPKGLPPEVVERMRRHYDRGTQRAVLRLYRATDARTMVDASPAVLAAADRPALVVWGTQDIYIPTRFAYRHAAAFPSVRVATLPESGHFPMADDPDRLAHLVVPFLREQVQANPR